MGRLNKRAANVSEPPTTSSTSPERPAALLRRGWTTGACATAATRTALEGLVTGSCPSMVEIALPSGQRVTFSVAKHDAGQGWVSAGVVKDAGDDPDVTHGALVVAKVIRGRDGTGVTFKAGEGVGTVTKPGLPLAVDEPAINPVPRQMMRQAVAEVVALLDGPGDVEIEISIPGGVKIAEKTLNARLGIVGGLSILGTTGIVIPYSCAAWISSIHRGIDVARAMGLTHIAGSTGTTSEAAVQRLFGLPDSALIEMGDFVGGMLKYLHKHPVPHLTIAGGFAKMVKLGQGLLDLHSKRGAIDTEWLAALLARHSSPEDLVELTRHANSALQVLQACSERGVPAGIYLAEAAWVTARRALDGAPIKLDVVVFDRDGREVGRWG